MGFKKQKKTNILKFKFILFMNKKKHEKENVSINFNFKILFKLKLRIINKMSTSNGNRITKRKAFDFC